MKYKVLYLFPRILMVVYILFLAIFALDVFKAGRSVIGILTGLFMHLIPNIVLAIVLAFAWKQQIMGGLSLIIIGVIMFYIFRNPPGINIGLFGPVILSGGLFIAGGLLKLNKGGERWT